MPKYTKMYTLVPAETYHGNLIYNHACKPNQLISKVSRDHLKPGDIVTVRFVFDGETYADFRYVKITRIMSNKIFGIVVDFYCKLKTCMYAPDAYSYNCDLCDFDLCDKCYNIKSIRESHKHDLKKTYFKYGWRECDHSDSCFPLPENSVVKFKKTSIESILDQSKNAKKLIKIYGGNTIPYNCRDIASCV